MVRITPSLCITLAAAAFAGAALCTPSLSLWPFIAGWNPMGLPLVVKAGEIETYRLVWALVGLGFLIGAGVWLGGANSAWRGRIEKDYAAFSAETSVSSGGLSLFVRFWFVLSLVIALLLVQSFRWSHAYHGKGVLWYDTLVLESGIWETMTAATLFAAVALILRSVVKFKHRFRGAAAKWAPLLFGFSLIVGAAEEINWGQHWLGFATPEFMQAVNDQREFNFHNIGTHWANHLMVLFFLSYVGLLPSLAWVFKEIRYVIDRLNIPLAPAAFVPFAFVGVSMSEASRRLWGTPLWSPNEARETLFGVVMLGVAIAYWMRLKERK